MSNEHATIATDTATKPLVLPVINAYMHINNGGVTLEVVDVVGSGPQLEIRANHFGNQTNGMKLAVTPQLLHNLAVRLEYASKFKYSATTRKPSLVLDLPDCEETSEEADEG